MNFDESVTPASADIEISTEAETPLEEEIESAEESVEAEDNEVAEAENEANEPETSTEEEQKPDATEVAYLKAELDALKKELAESKAFYTRLEDECAEFNELYPNVSLTSLPDSIWDSVRSGVPLAAAYALEARKAELAARRAEEINGENHNMSSGALSSDSYNDFFTPTQVRAMSAAEVRANYTKIINSMSKWH